MDNATATIAGTLYVVATPIGNLQDISFRAMEILKSVDAILAEDTRHTKTLLQALGIHKPMMALHAHNEGSKSLQLIDNLARGESFALVSDAGTPLISDPGFVLVREARLRGIKVVPIPGPCAMITALCVSGVPCDSFLFIGFLPAKQGARKERLQSLLACEHTVIVYESKHRLLDTVDDIIEVFGEEYALVVAKELTKSFEQVLHAPGPEIRAWLKAEPQRVNGEFVLILPVPPPVKKTADDAFLLKVLLAELPLKQAVKIASSLSQTSKNDLYETALTLKNI